MRRSVKSLMALAMAVSVSASMAVLSGCGAASGSKARDNAGAANAQTGTAAVNQTGSGAEAGTDTNTDTSTDTGTGSGTGGNSSSGEKTVIEYWHCNAETQGGLVVDELVKQFNESNDHIHFRIVMPCFAGIVLFICRSQAFFAHLKTLKTAMQSTF